ncbi:uncharacterized protein LOC135475846 [Liolophura sinensis]|uniref:uncharacterized protein LOC135475846 n=1 Tax=Liolophura sinensis TaxID=3198878 RepID=UPI003159387E
MTNGKKFILLYVVSADGYCDACTDLYPEFITVASLFAREKNIFFGKVSDSKLIDMLDIKEFPSVVYYEHGSASHQPLLGDISIDNLVSTVKKGMRGDFSDIQIKYTVPLTDSTFEECIANPRQHAFIIVYDKDSASTAEAELKLFEDLAMTFKHDEELLIGSINATKEIKLAGDFAVKRYPAFYWYGKGDKSIRKRYGGRMDIDELLAFVNDQTNLDRKLGGELMESAGRVPELDTLVAMYIDDIMEGVELEAAIADAKEYAKNAKINRKYAPYYVTLLKKINDAGKVEVIDEERDHQVKLLTIGELTPKQKDDLMRKRNILHRFVDEMAMRLIDGDRETVRVVRGNKQNKAKKSDHVQHDDLHQEL